MIPSDIATLEAALGIVAAADDPGHFIIWWSPEYITPAKVTSLSTDLATGAPRANLDDGAYVTLTDPRCTLGQFALVTRLAPLSSSNP